jgi:AmpE protein
MKLLVLLLVLALRRLDLAWPAWLLGEDRVRRWLLPFWQRLGQSSSPLHWGLGVLLPALLVALLFYALGQILWGIPGWFAGALLLLWLWGGESEFRQVEELLALGRMQDRERLYAMAQDSFQVSPGRDFFARLQDSFFLRDARVLFASIFWLILLGYWAVFLYLVNRLYLQCLGDEETEGNRLAARLDLVLFYPVARLLVVCLALTSDFQQVMGAVRGRLLALPSETLLHLAVTGVLAHSERAGDDALSRQMERLEVLHAAMLRTLALWLVIAAVWVMLSY